jgi:hypothetical protein
VELVHELSSHGARPRWNTRTETATAFACKVADRSFSEAEWREFFGDRPYEETCPGY